MAPTESDLTHKDYIIVDGTYYAYLYISGYGYPTQAGLAWLSPLVELGDGISISYFLNKRRKEQVLQKVSKTTMMNRSRISERQLSRFVYANYGVSYHALILQRRLDMAHKLLTQTSLTAEIIGQKVGFHNKTAFYSAFRKRYGTSPIKLRNNIADGTDDPVIDVPK